MSHSRILLLLLAAVLVFPQCRSKTDGDGAPGTSAVGSIADSRTSVTASTGEKVTMTASDGVIIVGTYWKPSKPASPAVLCLHQWRSDRSHYNALAAELQSAGYGVLAIDMRGNGESVKRTDGSAVAPDRVAENDVAAAVAYLRGQKSVDGKRIAIVGASYGSSNAVIYAAGDPGIKAVALLSPGINYFNVLPIEPAVTRCRAALLAVASSEDQRSVDAVKRIHDLVPAAQTKIYDNAGHGTEILEARVGLDALLRDFLEKTL